MCCMVILKHNIISLYKIYKSIYKISKFTNKPNYVIMNLTKGGIMTDKNSSDLWGIISLLKKVILGAFVTIVLIVVGFIIYLVETHKDTQETINTKGVYNLVNSESGEIIATDLSQEDLIKIMEFINGEYSSD